MSLKILKAGIQKTIQDNGRWGFQSQGVPVSGAMDEDAFINANVLVGNDWQEASIELLLGDLEIKFDADTLIAICGKGSKAFIDDSQVPFEKSVLVKGSSVLTFKTQMNGMWSYLSVGGGLVLKKVLNSCSTYPTASLGGTTGRPLVKEEIEINLNKSNLTTRIVESLPLLDGKDFRAASWGIPKNKTNESDVASIRVFEGHEWEWLSETEQQALLKKSFSIAPDSNRMGYRLIGQRMIRSDNRELISTAVTKGTIQLTNEGSLIVLMADSQTVGGYPRVAQVVAVDLPKLAQKLVGESVQFKMISFQEAERLFLIREKERQEIMKSIRAKFSL